MQVRKIKFFLVVVVIVVLSGTVLAQEQGIPVDIPGTGVNFFLYRYEGQNAPHEAINTIWANLSNAFAQWVDGGQKPQALSGQDVRIQTDASGMVGIYLKDQLIVEVDQYHATMNKATRLQLAEKWAVNLRQGVDEFVANNRIK